MTATDTAGDRHTDPEVVAARVQSGESACASDAGRAITPPAATRWQDVGAAIMGLGQTLGEDLRYDGRGRLLNADLESYRIPTSEDIPPELESILVENGDGPGPFGAKGIGESGIMATAPSVGNALHDATGVRIRALPLTAERVWRALTRPALAPAQHAGTGDGRGREPRRFAG